MPDAQYPIRLVASLLQVASGHSSAVGVAKNQPAKLAAFEGLDPTTARAPLTLSGWVDEKAEEVKFGLEMFPNLVLSNPDAECDRR